MTWVDLVVLAVLALSALLAFARGFVREALGLASWIGAGLIAAWAFRFADPYARGLIADAAIADPVAFGAVFIVALIVLSLIAGALAGLVRGSALGGLDRTLGLVYGLIRGAALIIVAYIGLGMVVAIDRWPPPLLEARSLPFAYAGAAWVVAKLPPDYRPRIYAPPPGRSARAEDLLQANPQGFAVGGGEAGRAATGGEEKR